MARNYKNIRAWQFADALAKKVYQSTRGFPKSEAFGLTSQMRRSAVSVPANIVEGSVRRYTNEYLQFLYTSIGSLAELGYYIDFSQWVEYLKKREAQDLTALHERTIKTLRALINYVEKSNV